VTDKRYGLGTMVNVGGDHWVAIALDFEHSAVWYGDSFGRRPVEEVTSVLNWWTFHILVLNLSTGHSSFPLRRMDIHAVCLAQTRYSFICLTHIH
jgi:hypothetical protein